MTSSGLDIVAHFREGLRTQAGDRPASFGPAQAHRIIRRTAENGGHSVSLTGGRSPATGYMVAQKEGSHIIPAKDFFGEHGHRILGDYVRAHHEDFSRRGAHLGSWHDQDSGNVFLDISHNIQDRQEAEKMAQEHNQISLWDLKNKREIPAGGTGGLEKQGSADSCGTCGLPTAPVSATMEFFRRGGQDTLED
jgi:hypothetical protein